MLGAAAGMAGLTAVEPLGAAWRGLMEGRLESLELGGTRKLKYEKGLAGVVAAGYLGRSASCLTRLDMRCPPLARSLALPHTRAFCANSTTDSSEQRRGSRERRSWELPAERGKVRMINKLIIGSARGLARASAPNVVHRL